MACLDDAQILDLVGGELDGAALDAADSHLDECPECRAVVSGMARTHGSEGPTPAGRHTHLARGAEVGRFVVLDLIGGGAMGLVYAAYDPRLDRRVALKILRREAAPGAGDDRLLGEARAMARLNHPNVVQIHDVGRVGDRVYLAMALIDGATLSDWTGAAPRSWRSVREVFALAGRGLAAAHAAGLVHRDFKPDNVIVGRDDQVHVTDFGLARGALEEGGVNAVDPRDAPDVLALSHTQTRTGALVGTPAYMAPEQLRGEAADARSDQFSFCVALYEALYGARPFPADNLEQLVARIEDDVAIARPASDVPAWLHAVVERGLSRRANDRFDSMDALLEALDVHRPTSRRAWLPTALGVCGLLVVGTLLSRSEKPDRACTGAGAELEKVWNDTRRDTVFAGIRATKAPFANDIVPRLDAAIGQWGARWTTAHIATCRATRVTKQQSVAALDARMSCLGRRLGEVDALLDRLSSADLATAGRALDAVAALPSLDDCADVTSLLSMVPPPGDEASVAARKALETGVASLRATIALGDYQEASRRAVDLIAAATKLGYAPLTAEAKLARADALRRAGTPARADAIAYEALFEAQVARDDRNVARAWLMLVAIAGERGVYAEARARLRHARAAVTRLGPMPTLDAAVASATGVIAYNMKEYDAAERGLTLALQIRTRSLGRDHIDVARTYTNLGNLARARGNLDEALAHHRRAQAIDRQARGDNHPTASRHLHNIAGVLRRKGQFDEALATYRKALALATSQLGPNHPAVALTNNSIGLLQHERGRLDQATASYRTALRICGARPSAACADTRHNLALVHMERNEYTEALALLSAAATMYKTSYGERHPEAVRLANLSRALLAASSGPAAGTQHTLQATTPRTAPPSSRSTTPPTAASGPAKPPRTGPSPTYGAGQSWDAP